MVAKLDLAQDFADIGKLGLQADACEPGFTYPLPADNCCTFNNECDFAGGRTVTYCLQDGVES